MQNNEVKREITQERVRTPYFFGKIDITVHLLRMFGKIENAEFISLHLI